MLKLNFIDTEVGNLDILVVPVFQENYGDLKISGQVEAKLKFRLSQDDFGAKFGEIISDFVSIEDNNLRIVLVGLGEEAKLTREQAKTAGAKAYLSLGQVEGKKVGVVYDRTLMGEARELSLLQGFALRNYFEGKYKTGSDRKQFESKILNELYIVGHLSESAEATIKKQLSVVDAIHMARDLVVAPPIDLRPADLETMAMSLAERFPSLQCQSLNHEQIAAEGMGLLLAVSRGSINEPRLIILTLNAEVSGQPIVLVGKGVTFDSGGYNIKPSGSMETMHTDMAGAAAVMGTMQALAEIGEAKKVIGIIPSTENLVSGDAYKPSDIVLSHAGKTIEIMNTDAEGRLILADAMSYAKQFDPLLMIDLATLTGACMVALGERYAGLLGNHPRLQEVIQLASDASGEKVWPLPLDESFRDRMKSKIADLGNLSQVADRLAGASTGAAFLSYFAEGIPWAHLDIAGPSHQTKEAEAWNPTSGASGFGVGLLVELITNTLNTQSIN